MGVVAEIMQFPSADATGELYFTDCTFKQKKL